MLRKEALSGPSCRSPFAAAMTCVRVALLGGGAALRSVDLLAARGFEAAASDAFLAWLGRVVRPEGLRPRAPGRARRFASCGARCTGPARSDRPRLALAPAADSRVAVSRLTEASSRVAHEAYPDRDRATSLLDKHRRLLERTLPSPDRDRSRSQAKSSGRVRVARPTPARGRWHGRGSGSALDDRCGTAIPSARDPAAAA